MERYGRAWTTVFIRAWLLFMTYAISAAILCFHFPSVNGAIVTDLQAETEMDGEVTRLPGFSGILPSKHFSGYVKVSEQHDRNLFYYFVTSERNPEKDPVVLWLNGGPGCSSFDGFIYEMGPFSFEPRNKWLSDQTPILKKNPNSWSKVANVIYLDSPAGVGFSYSKSVGDYLTDDLKTAKDSHQFLLGFFEKFPKFANNPFFIAGESYAGIYIPTLAREVVKGIEQGVKPLIHFSGYMIGNGVTDEVYDGNALVPFAYGMGLIDTDLHNRLERACNKTYWNPSRECAKALNELDEDVLNLNIYDILEPCYHQQSHSPNRRKDGDEARRENGGGVQEEEHVHRIWTGGASADGERERGDGRRALPESFLKLGMERRTRTRMFGRAWPLRAPVRAGHVPTWPELLNSEEVPCTNDYTARVWLNRADVRKAIHAEPASTIGPWVLCTSKISYDHNAGSMIPIHEQLTRQHGLAALIYSGDHDMCVPYTGSEAWTRDVGGKIVRPWQPWYVNDQVAGFTVAYEHNLTFVTVKGSGHTVPEYKPVEALSLFQRFLEGKLI